jgi:hypothetical protein
MPTEMAQFVAACDYPGLLDVAAVEQALAQYCAALGVKRKIVRLEQGWSLDEHPSLARYVDRVLEDFAKRNPKDARDARDASDALAARAARAALAALAAIDAIDARAALAARDASDARAALDAIDALAALAAIDAIDASVAIAARDARVALTSLHRFAAWCVQSNGWWWWRFDLSYLSCTYFGALQNNKPEVLKWTRPVLQAYLSGCWMVHWTDDTLYWVAKPTVHVERVNGGRRMHNESYAALESDVENIYFWHGVMVPAFVVVRPDWITVKHIETENNAEVRRVMIQRYGTARYLKDSNAELVHELPDNYFVKGLAGAKLYRKPRPDDSDIIMIAVQNSTPEGTWVETDEWEDIETSEYGTARVRKRRFEPQLDENKKPVLKEYMLRIQPDAYDGQASKDCHAALASTWRNRDGSLYFKNWKNYAPAFES